MPRALIPIVDEGEDGISPFGMERLLLKESVLDQRAGFEKQRPGAGAIDPGDLVARRPAGAGEVDAPAEALVEQDMQAGLVLAESEREDITIGKCRIQVRPLGPCLCGLGI